LQYRESISTAQARPILTILSILFQRFGSPMVAINLSSTADVSGLLRRHGLRPKKRLGQNFLVDRNTLEKIAGAAELIPTDAVLEIGPGLGALTRALAERARRVVAVEVDADLLPVLQETLAGLGNVQVVHADFLQLPLADFLAERFGESPLKVVANIPYYITSPILERLLETPSSIERILLLVQKEVADRLTAQPGSPEYGSLTLFARYHAEVEIVGRVSRHVFLPPPNVDSAILRLRIRAEPPVRAARPEQLFDVIHAAFQQRRKTLLNALAGFGALDVDKADAEAALRAAGIDPQRRGETLSLEEFARLAEAISSPKAEGGRQ
jgi:16S rRNA (adenine1518-N6/adenine1519-N6)-dimethyltransferase